VPTLAALVEGGYNVVGVITMPDKPAGRGHKVQFSPIKEYALAHDLPLLQPERLKDTEFLDQLRAWHADLQIVVAFRMLPEVVWDMPRLGTFNLHAALLPQYRGAAPINWAVINGETVTGATTFFLSHEIDTGRIILKQELPIAPDENVGSVHDRLMEMGKGLVTRTVDLLLEADGDLDRITTVDQETLYADPSELKPAPKIFKETCQLDWHDTARHLYNKVRGLSPYPAAWSELPLPDGTTPVVKIFATDVVAEGTTPRLAPGQVTTDGKSYLHVGCADGILAIKELQLPGKKRMPVAALLNGLHC
jgi:methionyl-tRNA formyltransferase